MGCEKQLDDILQADLAIGYQAEAEQWPCTPNWRLCTEASFVKQLPLACPDVCSQGTADILHLLLTAKSVGGQQMCTLPSLDTTIGVLYDTLLCAAMHSAGYW